MNVYVYRIMLFTDFAIFFVGGPKRGLARAGPAGSCYYGQTQKEHDRIFIVPQWPRFRIQKVGKNCSDKTSFLIPLHTFFIAACAGEENSDNESAVSGDSTVTQSPGSESPPADAQPADEVPGGMAGDHPQTPSPTTSHHSLPQVHSDRNGQNAQLVFRQADNLPDIQATEAESTVTVRLSSAGATNATTCTDNNVVCQRLWCHQDHDVIKIAST